MKLSAGHYPTARFGFNPNFSMMGQSVAEVHSRLQYQKIMTKIVDLIQEECRDSHLAEEVLMLSDECESAYENGPTGLAPRGPRIFGGALTSPSSAAANTPKSDTSVMSRFKSFFG
jgi:hypothetical protein